MQLSNIVCTTFEKTCFLQWRSTLYYSDILLCTLPKFFCIKSVPYQSFSYKIVSFHHIITLLGQINPDYMGYIFKIHHKYTILTSIMMSKCTLLYEWHTHIERNKIQHYFRIKKIQNYFERKIYPFCVGKEHDYFLNK